MIERVHDHNVDLALLPPKAKILDIGCRGFLFSNYFKQRGHDVVCVDTDGIEGGEYHRVAITDRDGLVNVVHTSDPQGTWVQQSDSGNTVSHTLESFSKKVGVNSWDLIKMDVEGSEQQILLSLSSPVAKQITVEFHLHTAAYHETSVDRMVSHLKGIGYAAVKHEKTNEHCAGLNYWSSLFVLQ